MQPLPNKNTNGKELEYTYNPKQRKLQRETKFSPIWGYDGSEGKEQGSLLFVESKYRKDGMGSAINMKVQRAQLNNRFDQSSSVRAHAIKGKIENKKPSRLPGH